MRRLNFAIVKFKYFSSVMYVFHILLKKAFPTPKMHILFYIDLELCNLHFRPLIHHVWYKIGISFNFFFSMGWVHSLPFLP